MKLAKPFVLLGAALGLLTMTRTARADVSSWVFVGSGPSWVETDSEKELQPSLQIETGLGTPPTGWLVLGFLGRSHTHFGLGTDLSLNLRLASSGFVNGNWGVGLDAGPYQPLWGDKSAGLGAAVVLGAPWGLTLSVGGGIDRDENQRFSCVLGVDFARLTVYRSSGESWFINPFPADRTASR